MNVRGKHVNDALVSPASPLNVNADDVPVVSAYPVLLYPAEHVTEQVGALPDVVATLAFP